MATQFSKLMQTLIYSVAFCLLGVNFGLALTVQVEDPISGNLISNQIYTGQLEFGTIDYFALNLGNPTLIDHISPISAAQEILDLQTYQHHSGMLYIMGFHPSQAALKVQALELLSGTVDLWVAYQGDLTLYLSPENADWSTGTVIQNSTHLLLPQDNTDIPLLGQGGIWGDIPLSVAQPSVGLDLAARVNLADQTGSKTGILTFTLIAN